ncbi:hypothetical protein F5880DRAFT_1584909 [Lentinula raphanica]|nr:hypothetical protein F5880DRAFT_1584909 [Lentinula raphanica]
MSNITPSKPSKLSSPTGRKKPHCRKCGSPREGHRKSVCVGTVASGSQENLDDTSSSGNLTSSDDEPKRKSPSRASYMTAKKRTRRTSLNLPTTANGDETPVFQPSTSTSKQEPLVHEPETDYYSAPCDSDGDVDLDVGQLIVTSTNRNSLLDDSDITPNPSDTSDVKSSLEAQTGGLLAKSIIDDNGKVRLPLPKAFIYASSDFPELNETGTIIRDRILQNIRGKGYHTSTFYTPVPVPNTNMCAYREWFVVGQGEDSDALIKHIARLGKSQSVLRGRVPGSFAVDNELEIVKGPRMVTMPQLLFASSAMLCIYILSML